MTDTTTDNSLRLQKFLAERGVASRRAAEKIIAEGRVKVNAVVVTDMGVKITPGKDRVTVDGKQVAAAPRMRYVLLHKPAGYICSVQDDRGRRTVMDLVECDERIYPVGRLDYGTSGLLLLTNDGELANHLLHPSHQVDKIYLAEVSPAPGKEQLSKLQKGVRLEDGMTAPAQARIIKRRADSALVEIIIHEGRNRQVRRMMEAVGCPVTHLKRTGLAFLDLTDVPLGKWRELSSGEVNRLQKL